MDLNTIKRDVKTVEEGKWVADLPGCGPLRLRVRGMSNRKYKAALLRLVRSLSKKEKDQFNQPKADAMTRCVGTALAETVLLEWDGLTEGGEPVPYDKGKALILMTTPDYEPFQDAVIQAAQTVDNLGTEFVEDAAKKLTDAVRARVLGDDGGYPDLDFGLSYYWDAFWEMATARSMGFGPGPIPYTAVIAWAAQPGNDVRDADELEQLIFFVRAMDNAWLSAVNDRPAATISRRKEEEVSDRPMSTELFDALFMPPPKTEEPA